MNEGDDFVEGAFSEGAPIRQARHSGLCHCRPAPGQEERAKWLPSAAQPVAASLPLGPVTRLAASPGGMAKQRGRLRPQWVREAGDAWPLEREAQPEAVGAAVPSFVPDGYFEEAGAEVEARLPGAWAQRDPAS